MPSAYSYLPLPTERYIRVLKVESARDFHVSLRCSLIEVNLEEDETTRRSYDALSYVWGAKDGERPLECDGAEILITANCEAALRYIRHVNCEPVFIWVDAICINQKDVDERSRQVSIMGTIYDHADKVIIWLGDGGGEVRSFFDWMRSTAPLLKQYDNPAHAPDELFDPLTKAPTTNWYILDYILSHEWVERQWTFQELVQASEPILQCRSSRLTWSDFAVCLGALVYKETYSGGYVFTSPTTVIHTAQLSALRKYERRDEFRSDYREILDQEDVTHDELYFTKRLLLMSEGQKATDLRDKVYGIYPILEGLFPGLPKVDYHREIDQIYEDVARHIVKTSGQLYILLLGSFVGRSGTLSLPSWVPDWGSQQAHATTWLPFETPRYSRHSHVDAPIMESSTGSSLCLKGRLLTVVGKCSTTWRTYGIDWSHPCIAGPVASCLRDWFSFVKTNSTLTALAASSVVIEMIQSQLVDLTEKDLELAGNLQTQLASDRITTATTPEALCNTIHPGQFADTDYLELQKIEGLSMLLTEDGNFGLCRQSAQLGDVMVLFAGSPLPVLLRSQANDYHFLGPVYLHGITNNRESWEKEPDLQELDVFVIT